MCLHQTSRLETSGKWRTLSVNVSTKQKKQKKTQQKNNESAVESLPVSQTFLLWYKQNAVMG